MISVEQELGKLGELTAWTLSLRDQAFIHQHVVDAWAAQHADERSKPIAVAFALIGLYLHLEKGFTGREVQRVHMLLGQPHRRGPGRKHWPRFPLPTKLANLTAGDVLAAPEWERAAAIDRWCFSVWTVWSESQQQVRDWAARELENLS
ncbi:MAG TPA: DUF5946 family protein [Terriglobales bacterium]|nr:DUF5946 family protein [Terriglobales bacterium]